MAESITISTHDTVSNILMRKRGIRNQEIYGWLSKVKKINPHISNIDRIFPGEKILIPNTIEEPVSNQQIWSNAFSKIPSALTITHSGNTALYFSNGTETIDSLAQKMFEGSAFHGLPHSTKRAILIHNNPGMEKYLITNTVPSGIFINLSPVRLSEYDKAYWNRETSKFGVYLNQFDPTVLDLYQQTGPDDALLLAELVQKLKQGGASVGSEEIVKGLGYGVGGWSGLASAGSSSLGTVTSLTSELYVEAVKKLGQSVVASKKAVHLAQVQRFLKGHSKYQLLIKNLKELPELLLPEGKLLPNTSGSVDFQIARYMRKQFFFANMKPGLATRMQTIANRLNGKVRLMKGLGWGATWGIPAVFALINVANASPERRMRVLFEEGFGIVGGAIGTYAGTMAGGLLVAPILCVGPFGAFVAIFICASIAGIYFSEKAKLMGGRVYDIGERFSNRMYYSYDDVIGALQ